VWFGSQPQMTPFYARELLFPGARVAGPAVITEYSSTTVVPPGFVCDVDEFRNLVLTSHAI
jgi:N-methylhydantoinase A